MADSLKINYFETSALNGTGINEAFEGLTKEIMKKKNKWIFRREDYFINF